MKDRKIRRRLLASVLLLAVAVAGAYGLRKILKPRLPLEGHCADGVGAAAARMTTPFTGKRWRKSRAAWQ